MNIRRLITRIIVPLVSALVLIACMDPGSSPRPFLSPTGHPSSPTRDQLSVSLVVGGPIAANQPVPVTVTLQSEIAVSGVVVGFKVRAPDASLDREDPPQTVNLQAGQPMQLSKSVTFPIKGRYSLLASMYLPLGLFVGDSTWVEVTESGGAVDPTSVPSPGTPAPAKPAGVPPLGGSPTPFPGSAVQDGAMASTMVASVTRRGFVEYQARNNNTYRARNFKIEVMDLVGPDPGSDRLLGITTTDADGN